MIKIVSPMSSSSIVNEWMRVSLVAKKPVTDLILLISSVVAIMGGYIVGAALNYKSGMSVQGAPGVINQTLKLFQILTDSSKYITRIVTD
jgi:phage protein U